MHVLRVFTSIILLSAAACQTTFGPTAAPTATQTAIPAAQDTPRPTHTPRQVARLPTATATPTPSLPPPATAVIITPPLAALPPDAPAGLSAAGVAEMMARPLPPNAFRVGQSGEGRDILAWRFGAGERVLLLVGGIHAGFETNTVALVNEMVAHFQAAPGDVLPGITLVLVPAANPDGLARGLQAEGRFNAGGVDLNRNWGCGWSAEAYWRESQVDPGPHPFSEPETQVLVSLVRELRPAAVVFYHSAARGVFAGDCPGGGVSWELAAVLGDAAGYPYGEPFRAYLVSGTAPSWLDGQGIPAVDVELSTTRDSELVRNLRGVMAVQRWLANK